MLWIAPSEKDQDNAALKQRLWDSAGQFRANSGLKPKNIPARSSASSSSGSLRSASPRNAPSWKKAAASFRRGSRVDDHAEGILDLAPNVRLDHLLNHPGRRTSERRSTTPCATSRSTTRSSPVSCKTYNLLGDIRHGGQVNSYYDDPHDATGRFDFVLANPPFNVNAVDKA